MRVNLNSSYEYLPVISSLFKQCFNKKKNVHSSHAGLATLANVLWMRVTTLYRYTRTHT